ncbi:hypothetical protein T440DRAFT_483994 [Plenodomus tracheiphilus IPT5]|uniref:Uncharacterized protein n=1 Tax=Plenodomus tracheiphilus IPT5 TaxID=1408161 RepID=A0A6A7APN2_9PLEO|nr:hypothetical protein T440DRAFT_483994 [Plenodomus tracheiphilus IPT5]
MLLDILLRTLFAIFSTTALSAPVAEPIADAEAQLVTDTHPPPTPPASGNDPVCEQQKFCGRVYFEKQAVEFDRAICMEIRGDWKSIWVASCQCTFWSACTPGQSIWNSAPRDIFLASMQTCEAERLVGSFSVKPNHDNLLHE